MKQANRTMQTFITVKTTRAPAAINTKLVETSNSPDARTRNKKHSYDNGLP